MTDFDLYGTTAAPTPAPAPTTTTIEALAAAEWTEMADDFGWQLILDDHTDYSDDDVDAHGGSGMWSCHLYRDDGVWLYDFEHCCRGGPQERNDLDLDAAAPVEVAQAATKKALANWIDRWTDSNEDRRCFDDDGEEDFSIDPAQEALERGELY